MITASVKESLAFSRGEMSEKGDLIPSSKENVGAVRKQAYSRLRSIAYCRSLMYPLGGSERAVKATSFEKVHACDEFRFETVITQVAVWNGLAL